MASACGVSWDGTSGGKLDRSAIPDDDFESHFLVAGDTKSDSSFPVVDGDGNLRAGNVNSAWDLRGQGEGVSEECLRKLDNAFEENVLPESAYENTVNIGSDPDATFGMNVEFRTPAESRLGDGFNEYGVRVNDDGSVDARFDAMEPGVRRGIEVTPEFLRNVASGAPDRIPLQVDHSKSQRANVGYIERLQFDDMLQVQAHIPNTGSSVRDDFIADFTHEPPQIQDISIGFDPTTVELRKPESRDGNPAFVDASIREFSLTPFPAGYDNGGLTPEFSAAAEKAKIADCDPCDEAQSQLSKRPHILYTK